MNISQCARDEIPAVNIERNNISKLTPEHFTLACKCDVLSLLGNPVETIDPKTIASLQVRYLIIGTNYFTNQTWNNFLMGVAKSVIEDLDVVYHNFWNISKDFFRPLQGLNLNSFGMPNGNLLNLFNENFAYLDSISELQLSSNRLEVIEPEHFAGLSKLSALFLSFNPITAINPSNSLWTLNINELYITNTDIGKIASGTFQGLHNLILLDLSFNTHLHTIEINSFSGLNKLDHLDLSDCNLHVLSLYAPLLKYIKLHEEFVYPEPDLIIPGYTFSQCPSLEEIEIMGFMSSANLYDDVHEISLFAGLEKLSSLTLYKNDFGHLPSGVFFNLSLLEYIDLRYCEIVTIGSNVFSGLSSLGELYLDYNMIQSIPMFKGLHHLTTISLLYNELSYIDKICFDETTALKKLILANNMFVGFNKSTFDPVISTIASIDLSGNPLACTCEIKWMVEWLNGPVQIVHGDQTLCSDNDVTLKPLRGKMIGTFDANKLCASNIAVYVSHCFGCYWTLCYTYYRLSL